MGIAYMAAVLRQKEIPYKILDMNLGYSSSKVLKFIKQYKPDLICTTIFSAGYKRVYNLINFIKSNYDATIVIGGPHVSVIGKEALEKQKLILLLRAKGSILC